MNSWLRERGSGALLIAVLLLCPMITGCGGGDRTKLTTPSLDASAPRTDQAPIEVGGEEVPDSRPFGQPDRPAVDVAAQAQDAVGIPDRAGPDRMAGPDGAAVADRPAPADVGPDGKGDAALPTAGQCEPSLTCTSDCARSCDHGRPSVACRCIEGHLHCTSCGALPPADAGTAPDGRPHYDECPPGPMDHCDEAGAVCMQRGHQPLCFCTSALHWLCNGM